MKLSSLQKHILKQSWEDKRIKIPRNIFDSFYTKRKNPPPKDIRVNIITKSIERLIDKGLLIGIGEKTQHKLFINQVKLTPKGKKTAQALLGQQTEFPFRKRKK